jgi:glycine C-acetyltransferase
MPTDRLQHLLEQQLDSLTHDQRRKGHEHVITGRIPANGTYGPRYRIAGLPQTFLRMNSNNYLGLSTHPQVMAAAEAAVAQYGVGPGAVRFISGTLEPHVRLETRISAFHHREAAMLFSSAYATVLSVVASLVTPETAVISDELNHNCIINAIRLVRPKEKYIYPHLDLSALEDALRKASTTCRRALVITDGVFSMRGVAAPLGMINDLVNRYDADFAENVVLMVDDSHGVGAFGSTGRGTEETTGGRADLLIGTLGKAFGVNGGYVAGSRILIDSLRETSPMYIYSNPITPGEASAACAALEIVDSAEGETILSHLRDLTSRFREGLRQQGQETLAGEHPIVPLFIGNTARAAAIVRQLFDQGVLATAIVYPVVPRGDDSIRFQVSAEHTTGDIDEVLAAIARVTRL